ncbi:hypothetical protein [Sorangium sp. So ce1151]|uniref:hypothetical protein n=1 Tax=Sorangium sp. So ce1151 TaxID=3133332 RepID=UPI003F6158A0
MGVTPALHFELVPCARPAHRATSPSRPSLRERILASTDLAELDGWIRRAVVVSDARELLATNGS